MMIISILLLILLNLCSFGIPAFSKEETVEGCVIELSTLSSEILNKKPKQALYRITLKPSEKASFQKGKYIEILSKASVPHWIFGRRVKVKITFSGDEKVGSYWLNSLSVIEKEVCDF